MTKVKDDLLKEIDKKIKRKKELSKEIAERSSNVEAFIVKMIEEIEENLLVTANTTLEDPELRKYYVKSIEGRVRTLDGGACVLPMWQSTEGESPRINGLTIKWSVPYQQANNCEEQLFVDLSSLLFK